MPITVLTGLPGTGKSSWLIEQVNQAIAAGRPVETFVCSDYPWPSNHGAFWVHRRLVCRRPGLTSPISHFVSASESAAVLNRTSTDTLVAVEEAYSFGPHIVPQWIAAAERGIELILAVPSYQQMQLLRQNEYTERVFKMKCQKCSVADATTIAIPADGESTMSICEPCFLEMKQAACQEIVVLLRDEEPFPGEDGLYQPVPLPEVAGWRLARPDTAVRAEIMAKVLGELGLPNGNGDQASYLDIGCNTGFFCDHLANLGFVAKGVDATKRFIAVARLLDSFYRRQQRARKQFVLYERANAYEYLRDTQQERFDVTSAFAVFQWVMVQRSVQHGVECLKWLFEKTKRVCFLEMGYTKEELYKHQLDVEIDHAWVLKVMQEHGAFAEVREFRAGHNGLQRDLFVGIKQVQPLSS